MTRSGLHVIAVALVLVGAPMTLATAPVTLATMVTIPPKSYVMAHFELDETTDLRATIEGRSCNGEDGTLVNGLGSFSIHDGNRIGSTNWQGGYDLALEPRVVEVGVEGQATQAPIRAPAPLRASANDCVQTSEGVWAGHQTTRPVVEDATLILWGTAVGGTYWINATWTRGVLSHEIFTGSVQAFKPHEFEHGVGVGVKAPGQDVGSLGVLQSQRLEPQRDFIGYWWPYLGFHASDSYCERDGIPCENDAPYSNLLLSEGPTTWEFGYTTRDELFFSPYYVLLAIDLPDHYLHD